MYVVGSLSQSHPSASRKTAKKCLHGMCDFVQSVQVHDGEALMDPKSTLCHKFSLDLDLT